MYMSIPAKVVLCEITQLKTGLGVAGVLFALMFLRLVLEIVALVSGFMKTAFGKYGCSECVPTLKFYEKHAIIKR